MDNAESCRDIIERIGDAIAHNCTALDPISSPEIDLFRLLRDLNVDAHNEVPGTYDILVNLAVACDVAMEE